MQIGGIENDDGTFWALKGDYLRFLCQKLIILLKRNNETLDKT